MQGTASNDRSRREFLQIPGAAALAMAAGQVPPLISPLMHVGRTGSCRVWTT